jgi:hypothetical protein
LFKVLNKYITSKIELDRIRIRETLYHKAIIDFLRKDDLVYGTIKIEEFWDHHYEEILDFHQDNELIDRGSFVRNYFMLIPPYVKVGTNIPEKIKKITPVRLTVK